MPWPTVATVSTMQASGAARRLSASLASARRSHSAHSASRASSTSAISRAAVSLHPAGGRGGGSRLAHTLS
jgi:hypothetical protein